MAERVLFVHAHPDDESISTGGTIATLVERGAAVTVLTCTRGELGEIVDPALAISSPAELALERENELRLAMSILGVTDHRYLGARDARWEGASPRVYVDSGMQWGPNGAEPIDSIADDALSAAPFSEIASDIAAVIGDVAPDAVVSYDERGGYGHPDHIRCGEAARRAADVMGVPFYSIVGEAASDAEIVVDVASVIDRKRAALLAYRSQLVVGDVEFAGANGEREPIGTVERFALLSTERPRADSSYSAQSVRGKILVLAVAVLFGAAAGLVLTAVHSATVSGFPLGAVAGIALTGALVAGLRLAFRSRLVAGAAAIALALMAILLLYGSASGSVLLDGSPTENLWAFGSVLVVVLALGWPQTVRFAPGKINR